MRNLKVTSRAPVLLAMVSALSLAACADPGSPDATGVYSNPALAASVDQQLAQSTGEAASALKTLALIERSKHAPESSLSLNGLPPELLTRITELNWSGPGDRLVHDIADRIGYTYSVEGAVPANPPFVALSIDNEVAARAMEDVGLQVENSATVIVDPNTRAVTFRYDSADPASLAVPSAPKPTRHLHRRIHHRAAAQAHTGS